MVGCALAFALVVFEEFVSISGRWWKYEFALFPLEVDERDPGIEHESSDI